MSLKDDLESDIKAIFAPQWTTRNGNVVPEAEAVGLGHDAVKLEEVVVLYADLADSTELVQGWHDWFAAEVYKSFLHCASKIIKANGGVITAFDGDRIMAVFLGDAKRTSAASCLNLLAAAPQPGSNNALLQRHPAGSSPASFYIKRKTASLRSTRPLPRQAYLRPRLPRAALDPNSPRTASPMSPVEGSGTGAAWSPVTV